MFEQLPAPTICRRKGYHWFVVATVCVGAFMAALDASIINIALPVMQRHFQTRLSTIEWTSLTYILTLAALIVPFSRLSDIYGRRWMYTFGFGVFIVGSFLCGFAPTLSILFLSRILQAVGAAMLQANSVAIITAATPSCDRGKAIGIQASAQGVGLSLGPIIGGVLLTYLGWRWIFYVNVPVGILGTTLALFILPADIKKKVHEKFDLLGAVVLAPALVALIYIFNEGLQKGWLSSVVIISYLVMGIGLISFYFIEQKVHSPMVDFSLFRSRIFLLGNLGTMFSFVVMYADMFLTPFYLDNVRNMSSLASGLYLTAIPIGMTIFTPLSGAIADKLGPKFPSVAGMVITAIGSLLLAWSSIHYTPLALIGGLFCVGIGMGAFTPPNNSLVMGSVAANRLGITGGVLNMARTLGMGLGVTFAGLAYQLFLTMRPGVESVTSVMPQQMIPAFRDAFIVFAVMASVVAVISWFTTENS